MKAATKSKVTRKVSVVKLVPISDAMSAAAREIKDNMTEMQKSQLYLKEGKLLMETFNFAGAIECLNEAVSINPHNSNIFLARASCYKSIHMYAEAFFDYSFLIKLEPVNGGHYCSRGLCSAKLKRIALALEDLDAAIEIEPTALHLCSRGTILAECNQLEFAVKDFSKAIILQDDQQQNSEFKMRCIYRRASVFYDMKKYNAAIKDLMTILIQEPQMVYSRILLGKCLKMVGELEKAEEQILHAIFIEVDQSSHYSELGDIRYQMDEKKKIKMAIKDFDRAVTLLEEQNVRTLKTVTARVNAQALVQVMKATATAQKVAPADRAALEPQAGDIKNIPDKNTEKMDKTTDKNEKNERNDRNTDRNTDRGDRNTDGGDKSTDRGDRNTDGGDKSTDRGDRNTDRGDRNTDRGDKNGNKNDDKNTKKPKKTLTRVISFCARTGEIIYPDVPVMTREMVRQGQINAMLMRTLNAVPDSFTVTNNKKKDHSNSGNNSNKGNSSDNLENLAESLSFRRNALEMRNDEVITKLKPPRKVRKSITGIVSGATVAVVHTATAAKSATVVPEKNNNEMTKDSSKNNSNNNNKNNNNNHNNNNITTNNNNINHNNNNNVNSNNKNNNNSSSSNNNSSHSIHTHNTHSTHNSHDNNNDSDSDDDSQSVSSYRPSTAQETELAIQSAIALAMTDAHEQLADVLFRRCQAVLMLCEKTEEQEDSNTPHTLCSPLPASPSNSHISNGSYLSSPSHANNGLASSSSSSSGTFSSHPSPSYTSPSPSSPFNPSSRPSNPSISAGLSSALSDAIRASELTPDDLEYRLQVAACHLRLAHFNEAITVLQSVLDISNENEKALFHYAFCLKSLKREKEAIECLTQIITAAGRQKEEQLPGTPEPTSVFSVPLGRVFEMRGTLHLETKAYDLATIDLSIAVTLGPHRSVNYYLRGKCHCKLRNFTEAIDDFYRAEQRSYPDLYSLTATRGITFRLLDMPAEALIDFIAASKLTSEKNRIEIIRIEVLKALCVIGVKDFSTALKMLISSLDIIRRLRRDNDNIVIRNKRKSLSIPEEESDYNDLNAGDIVRIDNIDSKVSKDKDSNKDNKINNDRKSQKDTGIHKDNVESTDMKYAALNDSLSHNAYPSTDSDEALHSTSNATLNAAASIDHAAAHTANAIKGTGSISNTLDTSVETIERNEEDNLAGLPGAHSGLPLTPSDVEHLNKIEWITCYHCALCLYHTGRYQSAIKMINRCILESHTKYATDEYDLGTCLFFKGVSLSYLNRVAEAAKIFDMALNSPFAQPIPEQKIQKEKKLQDEQVRLEYVREHNRMLCYFSLAKIYQRNGEHQLAVEFFTKSLEVLPLDEGKAFVHFRRAWSNKALSNYNLAGDDFETAKQLKSEDPNFTLEYRSISQCEYMEFTTEPDLVEPFPQLFLSNEYL